MKSSGFTLVELLISATIAIIATVIILQSTIGSGNVTTHSQAESDLSVSLALTSTATNFAAEVANPSDVSIYSDISYASQTSDASPSLTTGVTGTLFGIKKPADGEDPAICYLIGRSNIKHLDGTSQFFYDPNGTVLSQTIFDRDTATGNCLYDQVLGRSLLTRETVKVSSFSTTLICPNDDCQTYGRLRYVLTFSSLAGVNRTDQGQRRSSVEYVGSISLGLD